MAKEDLQEELRKLWDKRITIEGDIIKNFRASGGKSSLKETAELATIKARINEIINKLKEESQGD